MPAALLIVDYSYDFVADDGKLSCGKPAQDIASNIAALARSPRFAVCFNICDTHTENDPYHPETALFPPHNIRGTAGVELYGEVKEAARDAIRLEKRRYSAFAGTELDILLRERGIDTVVLVGVCTDICILHSAVSAYNLGYHIIVPEDAVASFNPAGAEFALAHFRSCLGARICRTAELLTEG